MAGLPHAPGGWTLVRRYLQERKYRQALQLNRYVIIQLDSDIAGDMGVARAEGATEDDVLQLIVDKICSYIAEEDLASVRGRLLFAIGIDEIECWLLPLVFDRSEKTSIAKTTGCLEAINHKLRKNNDPPLSTQKGGKDPRRYTQISALYRRRKVLDDAAVNPGFARFLRELEGCGLDPQQQGSTT